MCWNNLNDFAAQQTNSVVCRPAALQVVHQSPSLILTKSIRKSQACQIVKNI